MRTTIEWADWTLNPGIYGCEPVSEGCRHCYAARQARRLVKMNHYPAEIEDGGRWSGIVRVDNVFLWEDRIRRVPEPRTGERRVFVSSMGDILHPEVPVETVSAAIMEMGRRTRLTWMLLTKRYERLADLDDAVHVTAMRLWPLVPYNGWSDNVWLGVSVENQRWADVRLPALLETHAHRKFASLEPLLGPVLLKDSWLYGDVRPCPVCRRTPTDKSSCDGYEVPGLDLVIIGGETGPGARPMKAEWARSIRDQCVAAGIPFHFKQWGEHDESGQRVGRKRAGRLLDGREWNGNNA